MQQQQTLNYVIQHVANAEHPRQATGRQHTAHIPHETTHTFTHTHTHTHTIYTQYFSRSSSMVERLLSPGTHEFQLKFQHAQVTRYQR